MKDKKVKKIYHIPDNGYKVETAMSPKLAGR